MLDDFDKIISKNVSTYPQEVCCAYGNSSNNIANYPLIEYLLSSVLLRMTGFMEQKLDILQLILCNQDEDFKYNLLRKSSKLSSNYDVVSSIYKSFHNIIRTMEKELNVSDSKKYSDKLFENSECILNAHTKIYNIFKNSSISSPVKRNFDDFLNLKNRLLDLSKDITELRKELDEKSLSLEEKKTKGIALEQLKLQQALCLSEQDYVSIYKRTIDFRHSIAHNITSIKRDLPNISFIKSENFQFENYFVRFMLILSIDEVIRDMYSYYKQLKTKYLI